jgi:hypothetical protein
VRSVTTCAFPNLGGTYSKECKGNEAVKSLQIHEYEGEAGTGARPIRRSKNDINDKRKCYLPHCNQR